MVKTVFFFRFEPNTKASQMLNIQCIEIKTNTSINELKRFNGQNLARNSVVRLN